MDILYKGIEVAHENLGFAESKNSKVPTRGTPGAAGWDIYSSEEIVLEPYQPTLVPTDLEIALPPGTALLILPRSSHPNKKLIVPNSPGLIDQDFRGHLKVWLTYMPRPILFQEPGTRLLYGPATNEPLLIPKGERVAQGLLISYHQQDWTKVASLPPTQRGAGGFGSTG